MNLYYDKDKHLFSTEKTKTNECKFISYEGEAEHIGWKEKNNKICISEGNVTIKIHTNFWPEKVNCEWFYADISINGILMRPLSKCFNEGKISLPTHTIFNKHDDFKWETFLEEICNICNYPESWLEDQLNQLLNKMPQNSTDIILQIKVLKILREYVTNPYLCKKYRRHYDELMFDPNNVNSLLKQVFVENSNSSIEQFDTAWNYIKDYMLKKNEIVT